MENFDKAIEIALRTWYPLDHPLHFNPHHPLGKLLGEWGELLDDYMKSLYKPGYEFEPEDELGDIWYYLRILCYQRSYKPIQVEVTEKETGYIISSVILEIAIAFNSLHEKFDYHAHTLDWTYSALIEIAQRYNLTLDDLTASNWEKLKPGSERGDQWTKAKEVK